MYISSDATTTTFKSWSDYKLKLLFDSWNITEGWQFALTWVAVVISVVTYHFMEYFRVTLQHGMLTLLSNLQDGQADKILRPGGWFLLKVAYGSVVACNYALSLMFVLIAITFNPSLFLALFVGYLIGGYICCELNIDERLPGIRLFNYSACGASALNWWTKHSSHEHFALLAGVLTFPIALSIGYALILYTCPATITVVRGPYSGVWVTDWCAFEREPTQLISIQQSLGVFYGFLAINSIIMLLAKRHKSMYGFLHKEVVRGKHVSNGEVIMSAGVASLLIFNVAFWYNRYTFMMMNGALYVGWIKGTNRQQWFLAIQVTGRILDVSLGLLMIPVAKNSVLQLLLGISYDAAIRFHKNMGWIFVAISIVHVALYIQYAQLDEASGGQSLLSHMFNSRDSALSTKGKNQMYWGQGNWKSAMGTYGTLFIIPPILLAIPYVRRQFYNIFYFSHLFLHVGIVFLWLHASSDFLYMLPSLGKYYFFLVGSPWRLVAILSYHFILSFDIGLYAADLSVRLYARFACCKVTAVAHEAGGLVRIDFDNSHLPGLQNYVCGQFVRVCFPTLNSFEWHPFTICGPRCKGSTTILISPAVFASGGMRENDWSALVCRKACVGMPISIDGAFGAGLNFEPNDMDIAVCFVGGSGISIGLNVANYVSSASTRVIIFWSVRCENNNRTLSCLCDLSPNTAVMVYYTPLPSSKKDDEEENIEEVTSCEVSSAFKTGTPEVVMTSGRILFRDELRAIELVKGGRLGICICGCASFAQEAYQASCDFAASTPSAEVIISMESFTL